MSTNTSFQKFASICCVVSVVVIIVWAVFAVIETGDRQQDKIVILTDYVG